MTHTNLPLSYTIIDSIIAQAIEDGDMAIVDYSFSGEPVVDLTLQGRKKYESLLATTTDSDTIAERGLK